MPKEPYRDKKLEENERNKEDSTKYGEFVSSFFGWMTLDEQRERARKLTNITKPKKKD